MNYRIPKISYIQFAVIVIVCRIFTLMTHIPLIKDGYSFAEQLLAIALSTAAAALLIIPSVIYYRKAQGGIIESIYSGSKPFGIIAAVLYLVYLLLACTTDVSEFSAFIGSRFSFGADEAVISLILIVVCIYCACCGVEGICRSGGAVIVMFLIMAAFMLYGSCDKISLENIHCGITWDNALSASLDDLAGGTELVALCLMAKYTRDKYRCGAYLSLAGRLILGAGITLSAVIILGDYAYICSYPFLDIGSAAGIRFLQRIDAVYMIVWSLAAVLTLSLKIFLASDIMRTVFSKKLPMAAIFSAAAYAMSVFSITGNKILMLSLLTVCTVIIPIIQLTSKGMPVNKKSKEDRHERS